LVAVLKTFASGPGQWRGLEIGNCEEEVASSAGSEATCQIEETRISTGKELKVTIHHQQQQSCFPQGVQEQEQEQEKDFFDLLPDQDNRSQKDKHWADDLVEMFIKFVKLWRMVSYSFRLDIYILVHTQNVEQLHNVY
jgi:hypothetical protein